MEYFFSEKNMELKKGQTKLRNRPTGPTTIVDRRASCIQVELKKTCETLLNVKPSDLLPSATSQSDFAVNFQGINTERRKNCKVKVKIKLVKHEQHLKSMSNRFTQQM